MELRVKILGLWNDRLGDEDLRVANGPSTLNNPKTA